MEVFHPRGRKFSSFQWLGDGMNQMMNSGLFRTVAATQSQLLLCEHKNTISCFQNTLSAASKNTLSCCVHSLQLSILQFPLSQFFFAHRRCNSFSFLGHIFSPKANTYLFRRKPCYEQGGQADIKLFCFSSLWPSGLRWPGLTSLAWLGGFTSGRKLAARPTIIHRYNPLTLYPSHASLLPRQNHITFLGYLIVWLFPSLICGSAVCMDDMWTCQLSGGTWYIHTVIKSDSWVEHI